MFQVPGKYHHNLAFTVKFFNEDYREGFKLKINQGSNTQIFLGTGVVTHMNGLFSW